MTDDEQKIADAEPKKPQCSPYGLAAVELA